MKKVIVLTSSGGRGHISATQALQEYLRDYEVKPVFAFQEPLGKLDLLDQLTGNRLTAEDLYNILLRKKYYRLINLFCKIGSWYFRATHAHITQLFISYFEKERPDIIISVIPLINGAVLDASRHLDIPFMVIPTDLDSTTFVHGINHPTFEKFRYCLPFNDASIKKIIESAHLQKKQIKITGFPVRSSFLQEKNNNELRERYQITPHVKTLLIMLGGLGSNALFNFIKQLKNSSTPLHLLICIGKNERMRATLSSLILPPHITSTIIGFTDKISDLMAVSDIFITKSGSVSVCEALYMRLPLVLDASSSLLAWEKLNHTYVKQYHVGLSVYTYQDIVPLIQNLITNKQRLAAMKNAFNTVEKPNAQIHIEAIIKELIGLSRVAQKTPVYTNDYFCPEDRVST